jgi:hypothetical protein
LTALEFIGFDIHSERDEKSLHNKKDGYALASYQLVRITSKHGVQGRDGIWFCVALYGILVTAFLSVLSHISAAAQDDKGNTFCIAASLLVIIAWSNLLFFGDFFGRQGTDRQSSGYGVHWDGPTT